MIVFSRGFFRLICSIRDINGVKIFLNRYVVLHFIKNNVFSFFYSWPCRNSWLEPNFPSILPQEPPRPPTWRAFITHMHSLWQQPKRQRHKRIIYKASKDTRSTTLGLPFPKDTSGTYYRLQNFLSTTLL